MCGESVSGIAASRLALKSALIAVLLVVAPTADAQPARAVVDPVLAESSRALASGDVDRALLLSRDYLKRHPGDARAQVLLVRIHLEREEIDSAYQVINRAARAHPADVDVLYYLGLVTRRLAADEFDRLVRMAPDSARVHQLQGESLEAQERRSRCREGVRGSARRETGFARGAAGVGETQANSPRLRGGHWPLR